MNPHKIEQPRDSHEDQERIKQIEAQLQKLTEPERKEAERRAKRQAEIERLQREKEEREAAIREREEERVREERRAQFTQHMQTWQTSLHEALDLVVDAMRKLDSVANPALRAARAVGDPGIYYNSERPDSFLEREMNDIWWLVTRGKTVHDRTDIYGWRPKAAESAEV